MPKTPKKRLRPFWTTKDKRLVRLYQGDVIAVLKELPEKSVQMVVTSPPYWGLRDYGTAEWEGGDESCNHVQTPRISAKSTLNRTPGQYASEEAIERRDKAREVLYPLECKKCGAKRIDQQIGSEKTPEEFVAKMVEVFREVRRVLRDDGVLFLNLGDSYGSSSGNLVGMPWRVALALQADGWVLRQDIIWAKPSPMPESVRNRCTKAHEYIFLLTKKGSGYFCDMEAVRENSLGPIQEGQSASSGYSGNPRITNYHKLVGDSGGTRNKRSVWNVEDENRLFCWLGDNAPELLKEYLLGLGEKLDVWNVASEAYSGAHFATFPKKLILPCILAGTSEKGCCVKCGAPWKRVTEEKKLTRERPNDYVKRTGEEGTGSSCANSVAGVDVKTVGWEPTCDCDSDAEGLAEDVVPYDVEPCVVLDPFVGSGTTCCVAIANKRRSVGVDLSEEYLRENAIPRIIGELLSRPAFAYQAGIETEVLEGGEEIT